MKIFVNGRYSIFKDDFEFRIRDSSATLTNYGAPPPVVYESPTFDNIFNEIITYDDISFEDVLHLTKIKNEIDKETYA